MTGDKVRPGVALAALGFTTAVAQVLLMRELVATFYGNELLFGLALAAWMAWVAVGSSGFARILDFGSRILDSQSAIRNLQSAIGAGLALAAALLPAEMALVRGARVILGVTPGAFVEFGPMVGAVLVILAPLCLLAGFLFTLGARLALQQGGSAGQAYAWESAGAVVGGVLFSFLFVRWFDPFQTALLVGAANLAVAATLSSRSRLHSFSISHLRSPFSILLLASCLLLPASFPLGRTLHTATLRWQWGDASAGSAYHLVFAADSPYGRLTIQARDGQRVFFENGLLAFETQGTFPEEVVHFPLLAHPDPREVLLIGGGVAGDLGEILKHPETRVTYVELDPLLIQAARAHLPPEDAAILGDPRVTLVLTDGRFYVKQAQHTFDVVILDLPEPTTGALNRFYTREFFAEVRAVLDPGGVFALGLPSAENYWSPELARRNGSVYWTLRAVFPEVVALPGEHVFFLASDRPIETDPVVLAGRLTGRGVETRWVTPEYVKYVFTTDRFAQTRAELDATVGVRLNRDLVPICYYYDLVLWLSRFYPNLRGAFEGASLLNLWWVAMPLALTVLLARLRRKWAVPFTVVAVGLAGMILDVVILFAFQVWRGTVYAEVSLIVAAFMGGLALGSVAGNRVSPIAHRLSRRVLIFIQVAIIAYCGLLPLILSLPIPAPTVVFPLLALAAGALTGMAFPLATTLARTWARGSAEPSTRAQAEGAHPKPSVEPSESGQSTRGQSVAGRTAGLLYGADLVGGCLGALVGAVLFVPVLGIPQTCAAAALVGLAGLLALV